MKQSSPYPRARKRFGQNFLHDQAVIDGIVDAISPLPGQHLVEIGPGRGALTEPLLKRCHQLDVIELDRDLIPLLKNKLNAVGELTVYEADALKFDYRQLVKNEEKLRIVGNLPYNITTPLLFHLLGQSSQIEDMCFMLQKEVVERICAQPGSKQYGRLSIMMQFQCFADMLFIVPPEAFDPRPKVESAIVYLQPKPLSETQKVPVDILNNIVTQAFSHRRKTISNTLKTIVSEEQFKQAGIDSKLRPEHISVKQYLKLVDVITGDVKDINGES